jgi:hypothetical protein
VADNSLGRPSSWALPQAEEQESAGARESVGAHESVGATHEEDTPTWSWHADAPNPEVDRRSGASNDWPPVLPPEAYPGSVLGAEK